VSIPIDDGYQHRKHELLEGDSLEIGLGILARLIARRLLILTSLQDGINPGPVC